MQKTSSLGSQRKHEKNNIWCWSAGSPGVATEQKPHYGSMHTLEIAQPPMHMSTHQVGWAAAIRSSLKTFSRIEVSTSQNYFF
jgi:hypothetical protein